MSDNNYNSSKKGLPGSFLFFLLMSVLAVFTVQTFLGKPTGKVDHGYQLEHLVNLDLVLPDKNKKNALSDNLVAFSGQFRKDYTEEGKKRYQFLEVLNDYHKLKKEKIDLEQDLTDTQKEVYQAAKQFLALSGMSIPKQGYVVFDQFYNYPQHENHVIVKSLSGDNSVNLLQLQSSLAQKKVTDWSEEEVKNVGIALDTLTRGFQSPLLGIADKEIKQQLKGISNRISTANLPFKKLDEQRAIYADVINELGVIASKLNQPEDTVRLIQLRSVRSYRQLLSDYSLNKQLYEENQQQLNKGMVGVGQVTWFVNEKELSSKDLENLEATSFFRWYNQAVSEWHGFQENKGGVFHSPDQPRNLVLDRFFKSEEPAPKYFHYLFTVIVPIMLLLFLLYFIFARQMKGVGSSAMNFGKSTARLMNPEKNQITFKDVAGIDEAKEELEEIVEFLRNPLKFTKLGGRIPKGVLCVGPPGTGKTLIAKAVAGEAGRPFFSIAGSDFVEMFVGVGASRIRDMFDQAKKNAPCIIFIDEIDAVGRHRGAGVGGGHDEREQTLNQLLVEMDGFDSSEGVILMAATNRPDVLDKALLRPGRFDRRVLVDLPDLKGRHDILKVHARKIKLGKDVDLMELARATAGSSGADLENILNEAALIAARKERTMVSRQETLEAVDKVRYGKERKSLQLDEKEKKATAIHEAGHAVVGCVVENWEPVDKVTIVPRTFSLGATHFLPKKNRLSYWKVEIKDQLAVLMGGRCAELKFVGDLSSGAQQDIGQASELARNMVCRWGMSKDLGSVAYEEKQEQSYIGSATTKNYSEATSQAIDREVKEILTKANTRATKILEEHEDKVLLMSEMLLEFETLDRVDLDHIMAGTWDIEEKRKRVKEAVERFKQESEHASQEDEPPPIPVELKDKPKPA